MPSFKTKITKNCVACGEAIHDYFCTKHGHDLYKCTLCKMLSLDPLPVSTNEIYEDDYFSGAHAGYGYIDYDHDKEPMRETFKEYLSKIEQHSKQKGIILDVGAATGFFMSIAEGLGWKTRGVEISKYATLLAQKKNLDVIHGTIANMNVSEPLFDVITMWDVLEHMPDPVTDLKRARDLLKSGGLLVLNTPDSGSLYAKLLGKRWHLIVPPEHIHYFNNESVARVLYSCGFETISITRIGKNFTLEYIFLMLHKWLGWKVFKTITEFMRARKSFGKFSIPINLRDNMFVIAKKR